MSETNEGAAVVLVGALVCERAREVCGGVVELGEGVVEASGVEVVAGGARGGSTPMSSRHVMLVSALSNSHWLEGLHV